MIRRGVKQSKMSVCYVVLSDRFGGIDVIEYIRFISSLILIDIWYKRYFRYFNQKRYHDQFTGKYSKAFFTKSKQKELFKSANLIPDAIFSYLRPTPSGGCFKKIGTQCFTKARIQIG